MDDFKRIDKVPVFVANKDVGHGGTFSQPHGSDWAMASVAWLKWQLKGDAEAGKLFTGTPRPLQDCGLDGRQEEHPLSNPDGAGPAEGAGPFGPPSVRTGDDNQPTCPSRAIGELRRFSHLGVHMGITERSSRSAIPCTPHTGSIVHHCFLVGILGIIVGAYSVSARRRGRR
jgi:hypothetical protein